MSVLQQSLKRHNLRSLAKMKKEGQCISMLTAYDVVTASCLDKAGIDILLVGDSVGNVLYGFDSTLPVTMDMTLAHSAAVIRGSKRALVVADLPFMSYQADKKEAIKNAGRCLAEAGVQAVKLEGASDSICELIQALTEVGIPVMAHIGLTPQSVHQMGGFYKHGKDETNAQRIFKEAKKLQEAGAFALVLECVEEGLAAKITKDLSIITIGIGSGNVCDAEVLVINDLMGFTPGKSPSFAKPVFDLKTKMQEVASEFKNSIQKKRQVKENVVTG